jgi:hypothetical protein
MALDEMYVLCMLCVPNVLFWEAIGIPDVAWKHQ